MQVGVNHAPVGQQCIAHRPFVSPTVWRRDDRYEADSLSSDSGRDRQQPLHSGYYAF